MISTSPPKVLSTAESMMDAMDATSSGENPSSTCARSSSIFASSASSSVSEDVSMLSKRL